METFKLILTYVPIVLSAGAAIWSFVTAAKAKRKAKAQAEEAKTEAEKAQAEAAIKAAELAMEQAAKTFISDAEITYKTVDELLKARGQSAGTLKKETVLAKLRTYAIENGITLDVETWSKKIDDLVTFTKEVNAKH